MGTIIKIAIPQWVDKGQQSQQQEAPQQRTIIPSSQITGLASPQQQRQQPMQPAMQGCQGSQQQQDSIPAMLRLREEVVTPETVDAMGGREEFIGAMNDKLRPKGIQLDGGSGPVQGGQAENKFACGTIGDMRKGYAKGTTEIQLADTYTPGALQTNTKTGAQGFKPPVARQGFAIGTPGIISGTEKTDGNSTSTTQTNSTQGSITPSVGKSTIQYDANGNITGAKTAEQIQAGNAAITAKTNKADTASITTPAVETTPATTTSAAPSASVSNAVKGLGFTANTVSPTSTAYYKNATTIADENLQKQGAVEAMKQSQNLAQAGVSADSAQANTAKAEQQARTTSGIAAANTQIAQTAEEKIQQDLTAKMDLAMQSGAYGSVNQALVDMGQQPIDFSELENKKKEGNLADAVSILGQMAANTDDPKVKAAIMEQQAGLYRQMAAITGGTQFDPTKIMDAAKGVGTDEMSELSNTFAHDVAKQAVNWLTTTSGGSDVIKAIKGNEAGIALLAQAESGDQTAMETFGTIAGLAYNWANGKQINGQQMNLDQIKVLVKYGAIPYTMKDLADTQNRYDAPMAGNLADKLARNAQIYAETGIPDQNKARAI